MFGSTYKIMFPDNEEMAFPSFSESLKMKLRGGGGGYDMRTYRAFDPRASFLGIRFSRAIKIHTNRQAIRRETLDGLVLY